MGRALLLKRILPYQPWDSPAKSRPSKGRYPRGRAVPAHSPQTTDRQIR